MNDIESNSEDYTDRLKLGRVEDFISLVYPSNPIKMMEFQAAIDGIGADKTETMAAKISQTIYNYLNGGETLSSLGSEKMAESGDLQRWARHKTSELIWHLISEDAGTDDSTLAGVYTQEFLLDNRSSRGELFSECS